MPGPLSSTTGVPRRRAELATAGEKQGTLLLAEHDFSQPGATFPFGAHVAVVEVDSETGLVRPVRHVAVDDCGRVLNPLLVEGQQHGGIAQGIGQALWEAIAYDGDGNPLTFESTVRTSSSTPRVKVKQNAKCPTP